MSSSPKEERKRQHDAVKAEVERRLVANADNFDKAILTYSSAGLALSLGFLKDFVAIAVATSPWLLYTSWALFVFAVVTTLASYLASQRAQHRQLTLSEQYNLQMQDGALAEVNWPARLTEWASYTAGVAFFLALSASTLFVALNLPKGGKMATSGTERLVEGAPVPTMQQIPPAVLQKGAPVPILQSVPQEQAPLVAPAQAPATAPAVSPAPASGGATGAS